MITADLEFTISSKNKEILVVEGHEVFGDPYMTSVLESSKFWLGDGTFKLSPKNYQIYTFHVFVLGIAPACLYALLPNKTEKTYSRLLDALDTFAPDCKTDKVLLDFEIAPINAFQKHHPASMLSGCYFHLTQSFVRKIGEFGLKKLVSENHAVQKLNFLNASSGHKFPKKKYENLKGKVQNLMQIYRDETDIHFFRAIASLT